MVFDDRSCLQYYKTSNYDEDHVFQLQIKPALISYFYEKWVDAVFLMSNLDYIIKNEMLIIRLNIFLKTQKYSE